MGIQINGASRFESDVSTASQSEMRSIPPLIKDEWYKYIIHNATEGFFITDLKSRFLDVNDAFCKMSGYSREELMNMSVYDIDIQWDGHKNRSSLTNKMRNGLYEIIESSKNEPGRDNDQFVEVKHRRKDGRIIDVAVSVKYIDLMGGILFHFNRDITRQKQAETLLKFSDVAFKAIREGIIITDLEFNILSWNKGSERILGIKTTEAMGKNFHDILKVVNPSQTEVDKHYKNVLISGFSHVEHLVSTNAVTLWIDISAHLIQNEKGDNYAILSIISDIDERKHLDSQLIKYQEHLTELVNERTQKLAETINQRSEFTRALVHELKTPLTAVISSSEILSERCKDRIKSKLAQNIYNGALFLNNRIDELLDSIKGEIGTLSINCEYSDPLDLVQHVVSEMTLLAEKQGQKIVINNRNVLPFIMIDKERIKQVIINLISNAIKFNADRGTIIIRTKLINNSIVFEILDEGIGISKSERRRLFMPYYKKESDRNHLSGLGLGLALSKTIIELHNGKIWYKKRRIKGSTFGFSLPLSNITTSNM